MEKKILEGVYVSDKLATNMICIWFRAHTIVVSNFLVITHEMHEEI